MCALLESLNLSSVAVILLAGYIAYYMFFVIQKPVVACSDYMKQFLVKHCPILHEYYWPIAWCIEPVTQTIISSLLGSNLHIPYEREKLVLADGGFIMLDWVSNESSSMSSELRPTVIILPGLVGSSEESYVRQFVRQSVLLGFRTVVFNYRGRGGVELQTPRTYCAANSDDLLAVIQHVKTKYSHSNLFAVGVSLGGIILVNYLAKTQSKCGLTAAMAVSVVWNMFESSRSLERPVNLCIFNKMLTKQLKDVVSKYEHLFHDKCDFKKVCSSQTIRDFDESFTAPVFGYDSCDSYYHDACIDRKIQDIKIPLLCLNAADDPFSPSNFIPLNEAYNSEHVMIIVTPRGGHIAFLDGIFVLQQPRYIQRIFSQFFSAIFEHVQLFTGSSNQ